MKVILNPRLIAQQKLTPEDIAKIEALHKAKYDLMQRMKRAKLHSTLKRLASKVTKVEFELQEAWHFEKNQNWHRFWELPGCLCGSLDNIDAYPHRQHYSQGCPIHGW